jgi:hypothetical protein
MVPLLLVVLFAACVMAALIMAAEYAWQRAQTWLAKRVSSLRSAMLRRRAARDGRSNEERAAATTPGRRYAAKLADGTHTVIRKRRGPCRSECRPELPSDPTNSCGACGGPRG